MGDRACWATTIDPRLKEVDWREPADSMHGVMQLLMHCWENSVNTLLEIDPCFLASTRHVLDT